MKRSLVISILLAVALCTFVGLPLVTSSCSAPPDQRVVEVQTLKALGESADAAVALSAQLYRDGRITAAQARQVLDFFDRRFQPAFRVAVAAVNANLSTVASPDLVSLAAQLSNLVISFQNQSINRPAPSP